MKNYYEISSFMWEKIEIKGEENLFTYSVSVLQPFIAKGIE